MARTTLNLVIVFIAASVTRALSNSCEEVWFEDAKFDGEPYTCGERIVFLQTPQGGLLTEQEARVQTALENDICADCWPWEKYREDGETERSAKRGIAIENHMLTAEMLSGLSHIVSWGATWDYKLQGGPSLDVWKAAGIEFYPMIWGSGTIPNAQADGLPEGSKALLGFNEPNFPDQANLHPYWAAYYWKDFEKIGEENNITYLVAPSMNYHWSFDPIDWLYQFFYHCADCKVDAISLHVFSCYANGLKYHLDRYRVFGKPMWVTEIACSDTASPERLSAEGQMAYMKEAIPLLEADEDVEMYAWFSYFKDQWAHPIVDGENGDAGLIHPNGTLTNLGKLFSSFASGSNLTEINITIPEWRNETNESSTTTTGSETLTTTKSATATVSETATSSTTGSATWSSTGSTTMTSSATSTRTTTQTISSTTTQTDTSTTLTTTGSATSSTTQSSTATSITLTSSTKTWSGVTSSTTTVTATETSATITVSTTFSATETSVTGTETATSTFSTTLTATSPPEVTTTATATEPLALASTVTGTATTTLSSTYWAMPAMTKTQTATRTLTTTLTTPSTSATQTTTLAPVTTVGPATATQTLSATALSGTETWTATSTSDSIDSANTTTERAYTNYTSSRHLTGTAPSTTMTQGGESTTYSLDEEEEENSTNGTELTCGEAVEAWCQSDPEAAPFIPLRHCSDWRLHDAMCTSPVGGQGGTSFKASSTIEEGSPLSVAFLIMAVLGAAMASAAITSAFHRQRCQWLRYLCLGLCCHRPREEEEEQEDLKRAVSEKDWPGRCLNVMGNARVAPAPSGVLLPVEAVARRVASSPMAGNGHVVGTLSNKANLSEVAVGTPVGTTPASRAAALNTLQEAMAKATEEDATWDEKQAALDQVGRLLAGGAIANLPMALRQEAEAWQSRQDERLRLARSLEAAAEKAAALEDGAREAMGQDGAADDQSSLRELMARAKLSVDAGDREALLAEAARRASAFQEELDAQRLRLKARRRNQSDGASLLATGALLEERDSLSELKDKVAAEFAALPGLREDGAGDEAWDLACDALEDAWKQLSADVQSAAQDTQEELAETVVGSKVAKSLEDADAERRAALAEAARRAAAFDEELQKQRQKLQKRAKAKGSSAPALELGRLLEDREAFQALEAERVAALEECQKFLAEEGQKLGDSEANDWTQLVEALDAAKTDLDELAQETSAEALPGSSTWADIAAKLKTGKLEVDSQEHLAMLAEASRRAAAFDEELQKQRSQMKKRRKALQKGVTPDQVDPLEACRSLADEQTLKKLAKEQAEACAQCEALAASAEGDAKEAWTELGAAWAAMSKDMAKAEKEARESAKVVTGEAGSGLGEALGLVDEATGGDMAGGSARTMERRTSALAALALLVASTDVHTRNLRSGAHVQLGEVRAHNPFIDDLEPVAPLDAVAAPGAIAAAGIPRQGGARRPALFVPPYLYPDAFPASAKDVCHCDAPKEEKLTKEEELWAAEVAKQLNLPLSQVMHPSDFKGVAHCDCGSAEQAKGRVFRYVKAQAANNSSFTVEGADPTFPHGSYWEPEVVGSSGLMAPADQLRPEDLPPQAPYDEVDLAINLAKHDRIPKKIARYLDQVESRSSSCDDATQPCPTDCAAGDAVSFELGNARRAATVLATAAGNALEIEFATGLAEGDVCEAEAGCSLFRVCAPKPGLGAQAPRQCVAQDSDERLSWQGHVERHFQCPENTAGCKRVRQVVQGLYLRKEGKPCRAR
ncbi:asl1 [Symbiodinium natans]|uniref:Asl1 protein n=1 Tax=Symbiodinium natans TaxID=878477 RepID=A0A812IEI3_9DINO|nr:asl1 [Symbiodinium natans]